MTGVGNQERLVLLCGRATCFPHLPSPSQYTEERPISKLKIVQRKQFLKF